MVDMNKWCLYSLTDEASLISLSPPKPLDMPSHLGIVGAAMEGLQSVREKYIPSSSITPSPTIPCIAACLPPAACFD